MWTAITKPFISEMRLFVYTSVVYFLCCVSVKNSRYQDFEEDTFICLLCFVFLFVSHLARNKEYLSLPPTTEYDIYCI